MGGLPVSGLAGRWKALTAKYIVYEMYYIHFETYFRWTREETHNFSTEIFWRVASWMTSDRIITNFMELSPSEADTVSASQEILRRL
jgi:hypothetical protein